MQPTRLSKPETIANAWQLPIAELKEKIRKYIKNQSRGGLTTSRTSKEVKGSKYATTNILAETKDLE